MPSTRLVLLLLLILRWCNCGSSDLGICRLCSVRKKATSWCDHLRSTKTACTPWLGAAPMPGYSRHCRMMVDCSSTTCLHRRSTRSCYDVDVHPKNKSALYIAAYRCVNAAMVGDAHNDAKHQNASQSIKKVHTTPCVPRWSPTRVLPWPSAG